ncbi:hypothetical protein CVIRNUC_005057 [Coccomyxa viridis]|uniref:Nudix hydrolase domain-containing protein n=1 Tax=Coccomyxa viridis TaxID=1274662 RepID=A0AAV1I7G1_9CHLO|nr:hypothetical protein CVIRNUC_005057 [Coccomyxa viridis]
MALAEKLIALPSKLCPSSQSLTADDEEELFDVVNDSNQKIGQEKRSIVHAKGLKHRAVYCFVFSEQGKLLMQQRSPKKKIGPLQWDLSVAEHLQPGESYDEAAVRGLQEELGITARLASLQGPLVPVHLRRLEAPEVGVTDCEFVTSFRLDGWQGEVNADPAEVHAWKFASVADVLEDMRANEQLYTPWFRAELHATVS